MCGLHSGGQELVLHSIVTYTGAVIKGLDNINSLAKLASLLWI